MSSTSQMTSNTYIYTTCFSITRSHYKSKTVLGTEVRSDGSTLLLSDYLIDSEDYYIVLTFHQDTGIFKIFQNS